MNWFTNIITKKAPERSPADQPSTPMGFWSTGVRQTVSYSESVTAEAALKHPILYRCLNKLSAAVASVDWYAEQDDSVPATERAGPSTIKALNALLQSPNEVYTRSQLLYWMTLNYACYGRVPFKVGVSSVGPTYFPTGIYPLTARFMEAKSDSRGVVESYSYGPSTSNNKQTWPTRKKAAPGKAYAYEILKPNLDGTFESKNNVHPLGAIGLPAQIITLLLQRAVDTASGHPNSKYIVACERTLTNQQREALKAQVENTQPEGEQSGQVLFLFNTSATVSKLDNDLSDIHAKMPLDDMARQIAGAFGIPVALLGLAAADAAKFSGNYTESRRSFWEDTIIPEYLNPFAIGMSNAICGPGARICFDYDSIQAMLDARITNAERLGRVTYLTRDEKREITGFEKLPAGQGGDQLDFPPGSKETPPGNKTALDGVDLTQQEPLQ